jgi:SM-20-related protein
MISEKLLSPKNWLDRIIPQNMKFYTNPYYEYPFIFKNLPNNLDPLKKFVRDNLDEIEKIGIISGEAGIFVPKQNSEIRNTFNLIPNDNFIEDYNSIFNEQREELERFFNISIIESTSPQILIYKEGCFYKRHSDNCSEIVDADGNLIEFKSVAPWRVLTTLFFITSSTEIPKNDFEFNGGELQFDFLLDYKKAPFSIKPKEGDFIAFLSNPYFSHSVKNVEKGIRISIVQWHNAIIH